MLLCNGFKTMWMLIQNLSHISIVSSPLHEYWTKTLSNKFNTLLQNLKKKKIKSYNLDGNKAECRGGGLDQGAPFPFRGKSVASLGHDGWRYSTIPNEVT